MTPLHAGIICTSMLLSTCACLYSCISAAYHKLVKAQALHMTMLLANAIPLSAMLASLPEFGNLAYRPWVCTAAGLVSISAVMLIFQIRWTMRHISQVSIKLSCDHLPSALCFALENGQPCLRNLKMDELSHQITGEALSNANSFWTALADRSVVTLESGQTWSFERTSMEIDGQAVYQITGTDVTERVRLNRELDADNRRLDAMNRRLRKYSQNVQNVTREKETLRARVRIHDELGHTLLRTRQFLDDEREDAEAIRDSWRQNIRLLLGENMDGAPDDSFSQLLNAAQAIGVTIDRHGDFPVEGTEAAHLLEAAVHESITNLVRHAGGTLLEVIGTRGTDGWLIRCKNDGLIPAGPIVEGGGLSSLRDQVEAAGGTMTVDHSPRFLLTLVLPEETESLFI